jgi:hypothetical protein
VEPSFAEVCEAGRMLGVRKESYESLAAYRQRLRVQWALIRRVCEEDPI